MAVAFLAGLLSFLSPCVLPLVPSYLSYVTGMRGAAEMRVQRRLALAHAALFVVGFSLIFVVLGATATVFGRLLNVYQHWLERAGGALIILFGLYTLGAFRLAFLAREARWQLGDKPIGFLGSVLAGVAFGAGWTPCIGPILSVVIATAATQDTIGRGIGLLIAYSLGLGVPFVAAGVAFGRLTGVFGWVKRHFRLLNVVSGSFLVLFGLLLFTNRLGQISGSLVRLMEAAGLGRLANI